MRNDEKQVNKDWQSLINVQKLLFQDMKAFWLVYMGHPRHGCNMFIVKLKNQITFNY